MHAKSEDTKEIHKTCWLNCISKYQVTRTFLEMHCIKGTFLLETFTAPTTAKAFDIWVYRIMTCQFLYSTETLLTFIANIRLHTFMTTYMILKMTTAAEFLLTNVTCEPSTFIVWFQQMSLEFVKPWKTLWTVSTWVRLCISVNTNMTLQFIICVKQHPAARTLTLILMFDLIIIWSSVTVNMLFMFLQIAGSGKTFITRRTLVRFFSCVDSHVTV